MNVQKFLADCRVPFESVPHRPTYDAQRLAEAVDVPGHGVAKTVLLRADREYLLAVLPAPQRIDLAQVKLDLRARFLELASEEEFQQTFPDCQIGALPPFGSQYEMTTLLEESLADQEQITFEGNTHDQAIRMKCVDFQKLENPVVMRFACQDEA